MSMSWGFGALDCKAMTELNSPAVEAFQAQKFQGRFIGGVPVSEDDITAPYLLQVL